MGGHNRIHTLKKVIDMSKYKKEQIQFSEENLEPIEKKVLEIINIQDRDDLPFDLPIEMGWPVGERKKSARAMVLIKAGYGAMLKKYPRGEKTKDIPAWD